MRDANLVWDEATLNRFLSDPDEVVPGSRMSIIGLSDPQARADIIAYLKKASK
jgi:cytochrome c